MPLLPGDHVLGLPDGRTLGYTIYGAPGGAAVLNCHGGLLSGHDFQPADGDARALALCVISPDRPGVGRTDRLPGHNPLSWVQSDAAALLEHLDVRRLGVMGWSQGAQYALAACVALGARVVRCAVIAGCLPLDDPGTRRELNKLDRTLVVLSVHAPALARRYFSLTRLLSKRAPDLLVRSATRGLPRAEANAVSANGPWLAEVLGEGARQPQGGVEEYVALTAPWGFELENVDVPVRVLQGTADRLVPEAWAQQLAGAIPQGEISLYPGEGHFIGLTRRRDALRYLADGR